MKQSIKAVCLGDSITWGFPYGPEVSWVTMLNKSLDGQFINKGINGNTTSDMLKRFERAVLTYQPTHLVLMGGINDVICGESLDRIKLNLQTMAQHAMQENIRVILGMPTAVDMPGIENILKKLRTWIKQFAEEKQLKVIHFEKAFYDKNGALRDDLLLPDGEHLTTQGYQKMFKQIELNIMKT